MSARQEHNIMIRDGARILQTFLHVLMILSQADKFRAAPAVVTGTTQVILPVAVGTMAQAVPEEPVLTVLAEALPARWGHLAVHPVDHVPAAVVVPPGAETNLFIHFK